MKRMAPYITAIMILALAGLTSAWADCSRDKLDGTMDKYFESIMAHDASILPLAPDAKFTENGAVKKVGEGIWETAGKPLLRRTLIDTGSVLRPQFP